MKKQLINLGTAVLLRAVFGIFCFPSPYPLAAQELTPSFAIQHVDVFDGYRMLRDQTVVVESGMIQSVLPSIQAASAGAEIIDGHGKTLLPGLIDAHVHIGQVNSLEQAAALGVTTELDMYASDPQSLMRWRAEIEHGQRPNAADLRTAGYGVTVPRGHPTEFSRPPGIPPLPTLGPKDDPQRFVDDRIVEGSDYIKVIYEHQGPTLTKEQLGAIVRAAHRRSKLVIAHISTQAEAYDAIEAGADGLGHIFMDSPPRADFAALAASHHIFVIGTLSVLQAFSRASKGAELAADPRLGPFIYGTGWQMLHIQLPESATKNNHFTYAEMAIRQLHSAGVPLLAGTDAPNPDTAWGVSLHNELVLLVESGLTPIDALHAATAGVTEQFCLVDRGRIEPGRRADMLLVDGDPSKDILVTRNIVAVWTAGHRVDRELIKERVQQDRKQSSKPRAE